MKLILALLVLSNLAVGQTMMAGPSLVGGPSGFASASCTTPTGTNFTESWGDSSTSCWASGPSQCDHTYTITGTVGQSIIATPASAPAGACANSLQIAYVLGSAAALSTNFTAITSGTFDVLGSVDVTTGVSAGNNGYLLCLTVNAGTCDTTGTIAALILAESSGQKFEGSGSTNSALVTATTNAWHTFDIHVDLGTRTNCSLAIDGGAAQTFTCNTGSPATIYFGPQHFVNSSYTYVIPNINF